MNLDSTCTGLIQVQDITLSTQVQALPQLSFNLTRAKARSTLICAHTQELLRGYN